VAVQGKVKLSGQSTELFSFIDSSETPVDMRKPARPEPGGLGVAATLLLLLLLLEDEGVSLVGDFGKFREQERVSYLCPVNQQRATQ